MSASQIRCRAAAMYVTYTNSVLVMCLSLQPSLELVQRLETPPLELLHPQVVDLVDRHRIQVVVLLPSPPHDAHEIRLLQHAQMLRHRLPRHVHLLAQLAEREPAFGEQAVEQPAAAGIRECLEDRVHGAGALCKELLACQ